MLLCAKVFALRGHFGQALKMLKSITAVHHDTPAFVPAMLLSAAINIQRGRPRQAMSDLEMLLAETSLQIFSHPKTVSRGHVQLLLARLCELVANRQGIARTDSTASVSANRNGGASVVVGSTNSSMSALYTQAALAIEQEFVAQKFGLTSTADAAPVHTSTCYHQTFLVEPVRPKNHAGTSSVDWLRLFDMFRAQDSHVWACLCFDKLVEMLREDEKASSTSIVDAEVTAEPTMPSDHPISVKLSAQMYLASSISNHLAGFRQAARNMAEKACVS